MTRSEINQRLYYYLFLALAFAIPLYDRLVVLIISLLFLNWLAEGRFRVRFRRAFSERKRLWMLSFSALYLVYCAGLAYSHNLAYGLFDLEVKLSLLVFPLIFSTLDYSLFNEKRITTFFHSYLLGCVVITLILLIHALQNYFQSNSMVEFYYDKLSAYQHPSYFSMNLNFGIALIIILLIRHWNEMPNWIRTFLICLIPYFFIIIILLSSKAGIISLLMILIISLSSLIIYKKEYMIGLLFFFMIPFSFLGAYYMFPTSFYRLAVAKDYVSGNIPLDVTSDDGTNERILVWRSSVEIFKEHPVFGVGTGDVKDLLMKKYEENHITAAVNKRLNAHNQYFQTLLSLGLLGLLILVFLLLFPMIDAVMRKDLLYFLFLMIVVVNFTGESMLERQAGVVFYSFFNAFLFFVRQDNALSSRKSLSPKN
ncbi:MAG: O-antigen ligase family protein [Bacteroidetes bacterium]|nr:O-antigen ligase family protein [Bacteroidota bacterium]